MRHRHPFNTCLVLEIASTVALALVIGAGCASPAIQASATIPANGIPQDAIAQLPAWQQAQFADPEWQAPPKLPFMGTSGAGWDATSALKEASLNAPWHSKAAPLPLEITDFRHLAEQAQKRTSALGAKGEYADIAPDAVPPFGCNNDPTNSSNGHAIEDVIAAAADPLPYPLYYVEQSEAEPNYFTGNGGVGNDALSVVMQLWCSEPFAVPPATAEFGELAYRADLAPGIGPGGDCSAATAYPIIGRIWRCFNSVFNVMPSLAETELSNVFIAPRSAASVSLTAPITTTIARYQQFYCGALPENYGGGWIVDLLSTDSPYQPFKDWLADPAVQISGFFTLPVYGVLLKRWQDGMSPGMAGPWETPLGWPVFGPVSHRLSTPTVTLRGVFYAWGMWFERGFVWWIDYDQAMYPNTPDEGQLYYFTGVNVYDGASGEYRKAGPPILYNHAGPLGVCVQVDAPLNARQSAYLAELTDSGSGPEVTLSMHAHGYGGQADAQWRYKYYVWAFDDGYFQPDGTAFVDDTKWLTHTYTAPGDYTLRVQVTDAVDGTAFGYSLPIHVTDDIAG